MKNNLLILDIALANSDDDITGFTALENEISISEDGWALLAPFGEHRKTRSIQKGTQIIQESYVQIVDSEAVDAVLANENGGGVFGKIKRALIKRPIYNGHPDVKLYAPETVTLGNDPLVPLGVNEGLRKTSRGLEFKPLLVPEGAKAVEGGSKYPSALFLLQKTGRVRDNGDIEVRPFKVASIGMTPFPNISGVDSLANAKPADQQEHKTKEPDMKLIAGWLIAQNVALANCENPTEQMVLEAVKTVFEKKSTEVVTLGNERTTLTTVTVPTLTKERDDFKKKSEEAATALANEQTAFKAERKARCEAVVDLTISQGKLDVAGRDAKVNELVALDNAKLVTEIGALEKLPVKFKVATQLGGDRKAGAASTRSASEQIIALVNEDEDFKGKPFTPELYAKALTKVLAANPALKEQLNAAPATATK